VKDFLKSQCICTLLYVFIMRPFLEGLINSCTPSACLSVRLSVCPSAPWLRCTRKWKALETSNFWWRYGYGHKELGE